MKTKQMVVTKGFCPICQIPLKELAEFNSDSYICPHHKVSYHKCGCCNRVWEWKNHVSGNKITDVGGALDEIEQKQKKAS